MIEAIDRVARQHRCCSARATRCRTKRCANSCAAGAAGFKLHEDWGTTPAAIDACLTVADEFGVQVAIHTDTLNEAGYVESTLAAIAGRSIHTYHTEGAGGGHAPDIITVASHPQRAAVVDQPDPPAHGQHARRAPRHVDGVPPPQPVGPRRPGVRREPHPAEHDRRRGRPARPRRDLDDRLRLAGDGSRRRGHPAHVADGARDEARRGSLPGDGAADNQRARRYVAKYTICPAVAHGIDHEVGSVAVGKLADLVLWDPRFFGVRPHVVVKGGFIAWAQMGDANASIPSPQPVWPRPMFGASRRRRGAYERHVRGAGRARRRPRRANSLVDRRLVARRATRARWARTTCPRTTRAVASRSTPTRSPCASTANSSKKRPSPSCRWPSATSCSDAMTRAALLLFADGRFPSGSHAHSAGTEAACASGGVRRRRDRCDAFVARPAAHAPGASMPRSPRPARVRRTTRMGRPRRGVRSTHRVAPPARRCRARSAASSCAAAERVVAERRARRAAGGRAGRRAASADRARRSRRARRSSTSRGRAARAAPPRVDGRDRGACACSASIRSTSHALLAALAPTHRRARRGRGASPRTHPLDDLAGNERAARRDPRRGSRHLGGTLFAS